MDFESSKVNLNNPYDTSESFTRAPRKAIKSEIDFACKQLAAMGKPVTVRAVRSFVGKGSHSTISKYVKLWRSEKYQDFAQQTIQELTEDDELFQAVISSLPESYEDDFEYKHESNYISSPQYQVSEVSEDEFFNEIIDNFPH